MGLLRLMDFVNPTIFLRLLHLFLLVTGGMNNVVWYNRSM